MSIHNGVFTGQYYLVESVGHLLLVGETSILDDEGSRTGFEVYQVDLDDRARFEKVTSLGDRAIFLGVNTLFSKKVLSDSYGCKANLLYILK